MTSYDGFIRELVKVNTMISVCTGCKNSFFIPMDEFMRSNVELELNTFDNEVFVLWNWNILSGTSLEHKKLRSAQASA